MSPSRIFLFICLSFLGAVFVGSFLKIPRFIWLEQSALQKYNDKGVVTLQGIIFEAPEVKSDKIQMVVQTLRLRSGQALQVGGQGKIEETKGKILVTVPRYPEYQYGDELEIFGKLKTPSESTDFNYKDYLAKDDIYSVMYYPKIALLAHNKGNALYKSLYFLKSRFEEKINILLAEPQASFLDGLILGQKKSMPKELLEAFNKTGTTHLIALSGYNITIVAAMLMGLFTFLTISRRWAFWLAVSGIVFFVIMTGASPSVVRAAIMGILVLIARQEGRFYNPTNALIFAGTIMVFLNPKILRFDLGFQLSFLATCGLLYLSPILKEKFKNIPNFFSLKESLVSTLAAQIFVLPLLLFSFKNLSFIAPLANVLVLPIIPLTMLLGFLVGLLSFLFLPLAQIFSWAVWLFLSYEIKIIDILSKIPLASIKISFAWFLIVVYYALLVWFLLKYKMKSPCR